MGTEHVFVETNWVVDCFAPAHFAVPSALALLRSAQIGELVLHVPGICLSEARSVIRRKFQPRNQADPLRNYLRWAREKGAIDNDTEQVVRETLDRCEGIVLAELGSSENAISGLKDRAGVDVFSLTESMLELALVLGTEKLELRPFDYAILPAILTRAAEIRQQEPDAEICFCELDGDLQPWDKNGNIKPSLAQLYDNAHIWVYGDFEMTSPPRPSDRSN